MKIFIKDDLSFPVKNTENISGKKLAAVLRERGLIFNDITDSDFNYDIRNYENKLREIEAECGDKCSTFYIPGKSTTGINIFFLESERNGFPSMIKVVFPKMCSRHDCELGINLVEGSARFLKSNIIINDEESMAADAFIRVYNNKWIKDFVNSNASDIIQIAQKLNEGEEAVVTGLFRDLYVEKNTLERLKTGEPENIEERLMWVFRQLNFHQTERVQTNVEESAVQGVPVYNMSVMKGEDSINILYAACDQELPPMLAPKVDFFRLYSEYMNTDYFLAYLSFMDILDNKVEFLDERHFFVDENAGFKWFEVTEDSFEKADIKLHYYILTKEGKKVFSLDSYDCLLWTLGKYLLVSRNYMHGLIDIKGNEIVPPVYDYIARVDGELIIARKGRKDGIIDVSGNEIVPFIYDRIYSFYKELARVEMGGRFGFIDRAGNLVIPCKYDHAEEFSERFARVVIENKKYFIDTSGKIVINADYEYAGDFKDGLACVCSNRKYGFINKKGKVVIQLKYEYAESFHDGRAVIIKNNKYGFLDKKGKEVIPAIYDSLGFIDNEFHNGLICVVKREGQGGNSEKLVSYPEDDNADIHEIEKGPRVTVMQEGLHGFVDKNGNEVISLQYDHAFLFHEGLADVEKDGKVGFIDMTGKTIIPFIYENADFFFEGLCSVKKDGKYGCINKKGETVIPFLYDDIDLLHNGLAVFTKEEKKGVVDNSGKIIIEPQYDELFEHEGCFVAADWILKIFLSENLQYKPGYEKDMPMPRPEKGESKEAFMARCKNDSIMGSAIFVNHKPGNGFRLCVKDHVPAVCHTFN